jgi:transcriptional regulator with XRE-family HTH domain
VKKFNTAIKLTPEQAGILQGARLAMGLSYEQVAEAVGCIPKTIYYIESRRKHPSIGLFVAIADAVGLEAVITLKPKEKHG